MIDIQKYTQPIFKDNRGAFIPIKLNMAVQSNLSINTNSHVFRGMHLQLSPKAQTKYISVLQGRIVDILLDLNKSSETYKQVQFYILEEGDSLIIPKGYAHGFLTLTDNTIVNYLVDEEYSPDHEVSILWSSVPEIKQIIEKFCYNTVSEITISEKDSNAITLKEYENK
jgi:dTDP-4-dehydrorhamnose 3,5-epimerase